MKNLIIIISLCSLLLSCDKETPQKHTTSILVDVTNPDGILPPPEAITSLSPSTEFKHPNDAFVFSLGYVTDVHRNPKTTIVLDYGIEAWYQEDLGRASQQEQFNRQADSLIQTIYSAKMGYNKSHIFKVINRELKELSKASSTGIKRLILISDLQENSSLFSVVNKPLPNFQVIAEHFDFETPYNLQGVELCVIHTQDTTTEPVFDRMLEVLEILYQGTGLIINPNQTYKTHIQ